MTETDKQLISNHLALVRKYAALREFANAMPGHLQPQIQAEECLDQIQQSAIDLMNIGAA